MPRITARACHKWLGVVVGLQLLLWTTSGLVFSWNPIEQVRGEHLVSSPRLLDLTKQEFVSVQDVLERHGADLHDSEQCAQLELRTMLERPVYELAIEDRVTDALRYVLIDANSGDQISPISESTARQIAVADFSEDVSVLDAELLDATLGAHSEYRGKELPAWRVEMDHSNGTVIYISANRGIVTARRNDRWRLFDFFWMLHTMDYQGRDNFNTWVLRCISIFGVSTVVSGYWLWWRTSRMRRRRLRKARNKVSAK